MVNNKKQECIFKVGQLVRFKPSARTKGLYQDIERFGIREDRIYEIMEIRDGIYLYFQEGGGWPFNEFEAVENKKEEKMGRT